MSCINQISTFGAHCLPKMGGLRGIMIVLRSYAGIYLDTSWAVADDNTSWSYIPGRGSFQSVAQVDENTGASYYRDELQFAPSRTDEETAAEALAMLQAAGPDDLYVIAVFNDGRQYIMGTCLRSFYDNTLYEVPVFFSGGQIVSGTEPGDANGESFTLTSVHPFPALTCTRYSIEPASNGTTND